MGACLFVSAGFFRRLGGFDERFFVYFEEVDLCKRGMEQSRDNWFVPDAVITHRAGTSCESVASAARMTVQLRTSRVLYFTKHFGTMGGLGAALVNTMEALAKWPRAHPAFQDRQQPRTRGQGARIQKGGAMLRMLALTVRPVLAPDTRYRLLQYKDRFNNQGIELIHRALYPPVYYQMLAGAGTLRKGIGLLSSLPGRLADIVGRSRDYDVVWVGRELFPVGPALLEKMLFSRHPNVILDIDDALFLADPACTGFVHRKLRRFDKFEEIAHGFKAIVCGNRFLANYFERLSPSVPRHTHGGGGCQVCRPEASRKPHPLHRLDRHAH